MIFGYGGDEDENGTFLQHYAIFLIIFGFLAAAVLAFFAWKRKPSKSKKKNKSKKGESSIPSPSVIPLNLSQSQDERNTILSSEASNTESITQPLTLTDILESMNNQEQPKKKKLHRRAKKNQAKPQNQPENPAQGAYIDNENNNAAQQAQTVVPNTTEYDGYASTDDTNFLINSATHHAVNRQVLPLTQSNGYVDTDSPSLNDNNAVQYAQATGAYRMIIHNRSQKGYYRPDDTHVEDKTEAYFTPLNQSGSHNDQMQGGYVEDDSPLPPSNNNNDNNTPTSSHMVPAPKPAPTSSVDLRSSHGSRAMVHNPFGMKIDWNGEFQKILELPEETESERLEKYHKLTSLNKDFVHIAKTFGKIIISEQFLAPEVRTIQPCSDIGGVAGGQKYIYHGILFKFAVDWLGIYDGDQHAMKAAGHELKSVIRYYGIPNIHVPLMALIDYRGFRLVAMSILPLDSNTLCYGSQDGGRIVLAKNPELNKAMEYTAKKLNLKGHYCGLQTRQFLYGPCDIEGHKGLDDRFYVLDFARVFPPTAPDERSAKSTYLYQLFRPEFIRKLPFPLSSDAFSAFGGLDNAVHNKENVKSTHLLFDSIQRFAAWLDANHTNINVYTPLNQITNLVHREGINCRYFGILRHHVQLEKLKNLLLTEMIARVIKNQLRARLRKKMRSLRTLAEDPFKKVVLSFFELILGAKQMKFWRQQVKPALQKSFPNALTPQENANEFELHNHVNMHFLFKRIEWHTGVKLTKQARDELKRRPNHFKIVVSDIQKISSRVKHMNIVSLAEGNALTIEAMKTNAEDRLSGSRLFRLAMYKFEEAISSTPDNEDTLNSYADALATLGTSSEEDRHMYFSIALEKYCLANNMKALLRLGSILQSQENWREGDAMTQLAQKCYEEAIKRVTEFTEFTNTILFESYLNLSQLLLLQAKRHQREDLFKGAGEALRNAIGKSPEYQKLSWTEKFSHLELILIFQFITYKDYNNTLGYRIMTPFQRLGQFNTVDTTLCSGISLITPKFLEKFFSECGEYLLGVKLDNLSVHSASVIHWLSAYCKNLVFVQLQHWNTPDLDQLAMCTKLKHIDLCHSGSGASLDKSLLVISQKCLHVTYLNLSHTTVSKEILVAIGKLFIYMTNTSGNGMKQLEYLNLSHITTCKQHAISPALIELVKTCRNVKTLCLEGYVLAPTSLIDRFVNMTNDHLNSILAYTPHLRSLYLRSCSNIGDSGIRKLGVSCPNLTELDIAFTKVSVSGLRPLLDSVPKLVKLLVDNCDFGNEYIRNLFDKCPDLAEISLDNTKISDLMLFDISNSLAKLRTLSVENCNISDEGISAIAHGCPQLASLSLADCLGITDQSLEDMCHNLKGIEKLSLARCKKISEVGIKYLTTSEWRLKQLDVSQCPTITDSCIELIAPKFTQLEGSYYLALFNLLEFFLRDCKICNSSIQLISRHLHKLKLIDLRDCLLVSALDGLSEGCPQLEQLYLGGAEHISDESLENINQLFNLAHLDVSKCRRITDISLQRLSESCPNLHTLELGGNKTSDPAVDVLRSTRKNVNVINRVSTPVNTKPQSASATSPSKNRGNAVRSLMYDLKEIRENPLPLVSAHPLESNMFVWHANLMGPEGTPYAGGIFHFQLTFPKVNIPMNALIGQKYPMESPSATVLSPLPHPHVIQGKICLDILSDYESYFRNMDNNNRVNTKGVGWSSAYTVQTLLVQLQAFLMELDDEEGKITLGPFLSQIPEAVKASKNFKCSSCPHHAGAPWPPLLGPETTPTTRPVVSSSELDVIKSELTCYHNRTPYTEDVLGIGLCVTRNKRNTHKIDSISSPLEVLSYKAFQNGVRRSILNDMEFTYWMPIYINAEHFARAEPLIYESMSLICTNKPDQFSPDMAIEVLTKLMNTMVVEVMKGHIHASIKCLQGYCFFQRLLIEFVRKYPTLLEFANRQVEDFIHFENKRIKKAVSALGEFLPLLLVTNKQWKDIQETYLKEHFDRNVFWVLKDHPHLGAYEYDPTLDATRNDVTFNCAKVSLRLLMFHVYFLTHVGRQAGRSLDEIAQNYDMLYGFPTNAMKSELQDAVKAIQSVDNWEDFFTFIGYPTPGPTELNAWLRVSVLNSLNKGYHKQSNGHNLKMNRSADSVSRRQEDQLYFDDASSNHSSLSYSTNSMPTMYYSYAIPTPMVAFTSPQPLRVSTSNYFSTLSSPTSPHESQCASPDLETSSVQSGSSGSNSMMSPRQSQTGFTYYGTTYYPDAVYASQDGFVPVQSNNNNNYNNTYNNNYNKTKGYSNRSNSKTAICQNYSRTGYCRYGNTCRYLHKK